MTVKMLPYALEAEQATLGSCLLNRDALTEAMDILKPNDFYVAGHKIIFEAMCELERDGSRADLVTLADDLKNKNLLEKVNGVTYLSKLSSTIPSSTNVQHYAEIVKEKRVRRDLYETGEQITKMALKEDDEIEVQVAKSESLLVGVSLSKKDTLREYSELANNRWDHIVSVVENKQTVGLRTGFTKIDRLTGGLHPSELTILAARPSQGKTALALRIAHNIAKTGKHVLFTSLETSAEGLMDRAICMEGSIDSNRMRAGVLTQEELQKATDAVSRIYNLPVKIEANTGISSLEIWSRARRLKAEGKLDFVVVDYLQLLGEDGKRYASRDERVGKDTYNIKSMAIELNVPVMLLSQLNRIDTETRPELHNLRESGLIEAHADLVKFIWAPSLEKRSEKEIYIAKQRNGPVGRCLVTFLECFTRFEDYIQENTVTDWRDK